MTIPADLRVPFMYIEFDPSRASQGPSILRYKNLLIGQRLSSGTRPALKLDLITSYDQAVNFYGAGSQLALMFKAWFENNNTSEVYGISLSDAAGSKATGSYVFGGTATADGAIYPYIGGKKITVSVTTGQTGTNVGDALVAALVAELPVTGSNSTGAVTITAKNSGLPGNDIPLLANINHGEELPAGITLTVNDMSGGTGNPDIQDVIDELGEEWYNIIACPYTDTTNMGKIESELADRFGPIRMIDGMYVTTYRGTLSELSVFGNSRNSPHVTCIQSAGSPTSGFEFLAAYAAQLSKEAQADPARPFQTLELVNVLPPAIGDRFTTTENNILLYDGIATMYVDNGGKVRIQRAITMYQTNALGAADEAYLDTNTLFTLMYLRYDFRTQILTRYSRAKLGDDGAEVGPGQQIITPKLGKAEALNIFAGWQTLGLVENPAQFENDLQCYREGNTRLVWVTSPDLMNQFRVGANTMQFLLQSQAA